MGVLRLPVKGSQDRFDAAPYHFGQLAQQVGVASGPDVPDVGAFAATSIRQLPDPDAWYDEVVFVQISRFGRTAVEITGPSCTG